MKTIFGNTDEVINKGYKYLVIHDMPFSIIGKQDDMKIKVSNPFGKIPMAIHVECIDGINIIAQ